MVIRAEVCVGGIEDALAAEVGGADRVELCSGLAVGGLTPSLGAVEAVRSAVGIPAVILVRPRGGDFCYTDAEMDVLLRDVRLVRDVGAHGIATGVLRADGRIDRDAMARILEAAGAGSAPRTLPV
jgi:copper homeostasis protein